MVRPQHGFNLIEVMVSLTVFGILVSLGAPAFSEWLQSQRIRAAAEGVVNGLQVARGEAIRRNLPVVLGLEPYAPPFNLPGWTVCEATLPPTPCDSTTPTTAVSFIQSKSGQEGSGNARIVQTPNNVTMVTFSPLGSVLLKNPDGTAPVTQVDVYYDDLNLCSAAGGTKRCLRIVVSPAGGIRMCDPTPGIVPPDPRACP